MKVIFRNKLYNFSYKLKVKELMKNLNLSSEEFLVVVNGKLVTEDEVIPKDAEVKIIPVVSGG
ncbi:MAG: MoaD/ThiS family protein [Thermotogae bacterium]|nr:MoaD/ThiS family protein [Thermotogota bacterium]